MEIMEQIARDHLPDNIGLEWSGLSYQEKQAGGQTGMVMALVFLFVFLFLAAQYESWTVPIAVLLSLPVAALGAYLGVWVCGLENDVYFQIGLVMLVGLAAKNAILIVEFAKVQVDKGEDLIQSAIYAAKLRFRPILMTSLAFVLGMLQWYWQVVRLGKPSGNWYRGILRDDICYRVWYYSRAVLLCDGI